MQDDEVIGSCGLALDHGGLGAVDDSTPDGLNAHTTLQLHRICCVREPWEVRIEVPHTDVDSSKLLQLSNQRLLVDSWATWREVYRGHADGPAITFQHTRDNAPHREVNFLRCELKVFVVH